MIPLNKLAENKSASLTIVDNVDLQGPYYNVLRIKTTPETCVVIQVMFSTIGDEESYMMNTYFMFANMYLRLQPDMDLKPGNDVHINVTGYVKGTYGFMFET